MDEQKEKEQVVENLENIDKTENIEKTEDIENIEKEDAEIFDFLNPEILKKLEDTKKENQENYDKFLRLNAEFVNYKNRVEREKIELIKYAGKEILRDLLPFIDTFDSALMAEHKDLAECVKGFELVHQSLVDILKKEGLERIKVESEKFNPEYHEAVGFDNIEGLDDDIITCEMLAGYKLKDKVLRHSMVKINKK